MLIKAALKALALFAAFNVIYFFVQPLEMLDHITLYNHLFPGRIRFPFSDETTEPSNTSIARLEAMFASHVLDGTPKTKTEYRVLILGDSAIWGLEVSADGTVPACLDRARMSLPDGRTIRAYNLAYPAPNILRDTLIMGRAIEGYQPDLIVWFITLRSLSREEFALSDVVVEQREEAIALAEDVGYSLPLTEPDWLEATFWGQRRGLRAWLQHQLQGITWGASGVDYPQRPFYRPPEYDLPNSDAYDMSDKQFAADMLIRGMKFAEDARVPVLLINEPIFISTGANSHIRYNADYPRAAYDEYRARIAKLAESHRWNYMDLWDAVPPEQFIRTALHYNPEAACKVAARVGKKIINDLAK